MIAKELRKKSIDELNEEMMALLREQFNLRMQKASGEMANTHLYKKVRTGISRIKTIITQKSQENADE